MEQHSSENKLGLESLGNEGRMNPGVTRRTFFSAMAAAAAMAALAGCSSGSGSGASASAAAGSASSSAESVSASAAEAGIDYSNWDAVLEAAKGQPVNYYAWGGSETRNTWLEQELAPLLKEKYGITLEYTKLENTLDAVTQMSSEKEAGVEEGSIDFVWINGENFFSAKENDYLWGPFADYLPNYQQYVDETDPEIAYDFGSPVDGFEAPFNKAQMQMWYDSAIVPEKDIPSTVEEFTDFCEKYQGKVTYPQPGDFTGTAFICCLIAGVIGSENYKKLAQMSSEEATKEAILEIVKPGFEYLRELKPYLWKEGSTYPADSSTQGTMYADGELVLNMGYGSPEAEVKNGTLPDTTRGCIFESGMCGNASFHAIAFNAPHKAAAMVAINEIISPEIQLSLYEELGEQAVIDFNKLSEDQKAGFDAVPLGVSQIPLSELLAHRIPDPAGPVVPILEELWLSEVAGN